MKKDVSLRLKPYIQPFERELAFREIATLARSFPHELALHQAGGHDYCVNTAVTAKSLADRLTYWESVCDETGPTVTTQSLRESTVNIVRNGIALDALR